MGVGRGHGKLLLFGEHAAVYGYPSLGLQLPRHMEVVLDPSGSASWELPDMDSRSVRLIRAAVDALPSVIGRELPAQTMQVSGDLPMSVGLGSSAAFCSALLRAVDPDRYRSSSVETLWADAHNLERVFHGTPSGVDTGLSLLPGASLMIPRPADIPEARPAPLPACWLVAGAVPRTGSTASLVDGIRRLRDASPDTTEQQLRQLGGFAEMASQLTGPRAAHELGALTEGAGQLLVQLGLSTPGLDAALSLLRDEGALGCKLSGAGGGGAFFGVFADESVANLAQQKLQAWLTRHHRLPGGPFSLVIPLHDS